MKNKKVSIIGGCGHVGLPLGVKFALSGAKVDLIDINEEAISKVNSGSFPFKEEGGDAQLKTALKSGLIATSNASACSDSDVVVFVTGTPVDEHLNPKLSEVVKIFDSYLGSIKEGALIIMRSTLFPGTMEYLHQKISRLDKKLGLAFCPERVAQGYALDEIDSLPQIVSAFDDASFESAKELFSKIAPSIIKLTPSEAEVSKLMANSWRYLEFAIANQFYEIAERKGLDFYRIYKAIRHDYPRADGYKSPGFAAGPCLFKDTMQLASFFDNQFYMGHAAMLVNEGLAGTAVEKAEEKLGGSLWDKTVGILGMTFKANNDDIRESLSFKVKKGLEFKGAKVIFHDPYLEDSETLEDVLSNSDLLIAGTLHKEYRELTFTKPLVDVWGAFDSSELEVFPGNTAEEKQKVNE